MIQLRELDAPSDISLATELDAELRFLLTAHTQVQRTLGQAFCRMLQGSMLIELGYAKNVDYCRERLGISLREAEEMAWLERNIGSYPETQRFWEAGVLSRCKVREILRHVKPEEDFLWSRLAATMTVRELVERWGDAESPAERLGFELSPEARIKWDLAHELACRLEGRDLSVANLLEDCAAEYSSGVTPEGDVDEPAGSYRQELEAMRRQAELAAEKAANQWRRLDWSVPRPADVPDLSIAADADAWTLDAGLRRAIAFQQQLNALLARRLWQAERCEVYRHLGFASMVQYGEERLGMSAVRVRTLLRLRRQLHRVPGVADAYATGRLSQSQTEQVARVATPETSEAWIGYARKTTVRKLEEVVRSAVALRKQDPVQYRNVFPPAERTCASPAAQALLEEVSVRGSDTVDEQTCASKVAQAPLEEVGAEDSDAVDPQMYASPAAEALIEEVGAPGSDAVQQMCAWPRVPEDCRITGPTRMSVWLSQESLAFVKQYLEVARANLGGQASVGRCIETMIDAFLDEWSDTATRAAREHPVVERDRWRCQVPGCTTRNSLQVHHIVFKSQGGSNDKTNEVTLCSFHHLVGIHEGHIVAAGEAPDNTVWLLGMRPDGTPSQVLFGDTVVVSSGCNT